MAPKRITTMPPEQAEQLGRTIQRLREHAGLGVTQAARRCLLSDPYWYQLEAGGVLDSATGERRPVQVAAGTLVLIAWQLPVADPADQAELFKVGGYPELSPRAISLPRVEDLGGWQDYTVAELRAIEDEAGRERYRREGQRSRRDRRDTSG